MKGGDTYGRGPLWVGREGPSRSGPEGTQGHGTACSGACRAHQNKNLSAREQAESDCKCGTDTVPSSASSTSCSTSWASTSLASSRSLANCAVVEAMTPSKSCGRLFQSLLPAERRGDEGARTLICLAKPKCSWSSRASAF